MTIAEELREAIAVYATATDPVCRLAAWLWMARCTRAARCARCGS